MNCFYYESKFKIHFLGQGEAGWRGARVSQFFYKESKSKKRIFFLLGGGGGGRWTDR